MRRFGSPEENDGVARVERAVNAAMERAGFVFEKVQSQFPRAVGSEMTPPAEEYAEFTASIADNPMGVADLVNSWRQQHGDVEAIKMAVDFIQRNEERRAKTGPLIEERARAGGLPAAGGADVQV